MTRIYLYLLIIVLGLTCTIASAQTFSYTSATSTDAYTELDTSKQALPVSIWQTAGCRIPVGFSFNIAGFSDDTVTLRTNGVLTLGNENKYSIIFLNKNFLPDVNDANVPLSALSYDVVTSLDNQKIFKIEFNNVLIPAPGGSTIHCSFQVWLYQYSNKIAFHMGPVENNTSVTDAFQMGLINMNNTASGDVGFLLQGAAGAAAGVHVTAGGNLVSLTSLPVNGTVYTFLSQGN